MPIFFETLNHKDKSYEESCDHKNIIDDIISIIGTSIFDKYFLVENGRLKITDMILMTMPGLKMIRLKPNR